MVPMTSRPTPTRYFGVTKHSAQRFVCDVAGNIELGSFVLAPDADGTVKRRKILRVGEPFERRGELWTYGYLADGFQSARNLKEAGWTPKQISLLGPAEDQRVNPVKRSGPPVKLWSDATVARVKRTKEFRELVRTPEQRDADRAAAAKAMATKHARIDIVLATSPVGDDRDLGALPLGLASAIEGPA